MNSLRFIAGEGPRQADIMFVGEAPGEEEDKLGRPFVGRSGKLLNRWIERIGLKREDVYITNVVKVRPDNNRTPTFEEIQTWLPSLWEEIKKVHPTLIVPVGATATKAIFDENFETFAPNRGKLTLLGIYAVIPIYHPSYILRSPGAEKILNVDLELIAQYMKDVKEIQDENDKCFG